MSGEAQAETTASRDSAWARLPTGVRLIAILSAALLPLALIAVAASFQTSRVVDQENKARLRVAITESTRALAIELIGDMNALRSALAATEASDDDAPSCARARGVFAQAAAKGVRFEIVDADGTLRCGERVGLIRPARADAITARILPGRGIALATTGDMAGAYAAAFFPAPYLADVGQPSGLQTRYGLRLTDGDMALDLHALDGYSPVARLDQATGPLGIEALALEMRTPAAAITSAVVLAMLTPLIMWVAAVGIAWFVVDRLLIRPLRRLRHSVGDYTPGTPFEPALAKTAAAHEIRQLGETFGDLGRALQAHEADLAEGLVRQQRLTREVHHRVKNNLQVIASLINFHARSAAGAEASAAYTSIQRRVDALAVVHRNHFAEIEVNRGLSLRGVVGELAANIRATASDSSANLAIALEIEPFLVTQDTAVAVAFLLTELIELAMTANPAAQIRISAKPEDGSEARAVLRLSSPALVETGELKDAVSRRYGRVIEGLSRQLRSKLHYEPLVGAYEISIAVTGRD